MKLKNCPFCGSNDLKVHQSYDREKDGKLSFPLHERWFVSCRGECFFAGPASDVSQEDSIEKWNNRKGGEIQTLKQSNKELEEKLTKLNVCVQKLRTIASDDFKAREIIGELKEGE